MKRLWLTSGQLCIAMVAISLAALARSALDPWLGDHVPYATFFAAVALIAWLTPPWVTVLSIVAGWLVVDYFFIPPRSSFGLSTSTPEHIVGAAAFLIVTLVILLIAMAMHRARRRAGESGAQAREVLGSISDAFFTLDRDWRITYVNNAFREHAQRPLDEFIGGHLWEMFPAGVGTTAYREMHRAMTERTGTEYEVFYEPLQKWFRGKVYPKPDGGLAVYSRDVTVEKQATEELARRSGWLRLVTDAVPALISYVDAQGRYQFINQAYEAWFGRPREEAIGRHMRDVVGEAAFERLRPRVEAALAGERVAFEDEIPYREGTRHVHGDYVPDTRPDGSVAGFYVLVTEITQRTVGEQARGMLAAIVDSSDDAIVSKNLNSIITSWNRGAERLFGYTAPEAVGQSVTMLIPEDRLAEEEFILDRIRRGERVDHYETVRRRKDGTPLDVSLTVSPIVDGAGRVIGASKIARDISQRKQTEAVLRRNREELEKALARRTEEVTRAQQVLAATQRMGALGTLSAGLGHDMGNLLLPIRLRLDAMERGELPPQQREHVSAIRAASTYLQRLANGLRLLTVDPKRHETHGACELSDWSGDASAILKAALPAGIGFESDLPPGPTWVRIAKPALTQAVFNLVQNAGEAMRARGTGLVRVGAALVDGAVHLSVMDDGPGMPPEVKARCMEPFFTTKTRAISTGLGLSLVFALVRDAGGEVRLDSTPGAGTTFTLVLQKAEPAAARPSARGLAVVRVGRPHLRAFIQQQLRAMHFRVTDDEGAAREADVIVLDRAGHEPVKPGARVLALDKLGQTEPSISLIRSRLEDVAAGREANL